MGCTVHGVANSQTRLRDFHMIIYVALVLFNCIMLHPALLKFKGILIHPKLVDFISNK